MKRLVKLQFTNVFYDHAVGHLNYIEFHFQRPGKNSAIIGKPSYNVVFLMI